MSDIYNLFDFEANKFINVSSQVLPPGVSSDVYGINDPGLDITESGVCRYCFFNPCGCGAEQYQENIDEVRAFESAVYERPGISALSGLSDLADIPIEHYRAYEEFIKSLEKQSTIYKHWDHFMDWLRRYLGND